MNEETKPVVVIIGAGFGGLEAAKALRSAPVQVILLDRNNYHLFQPLLYQVATAGLEPTEIAYPVRTIFRKQKNFKFRLTEVTGVDPKARRVDTTSGSLFYDYLIIAAGSGSNYFGLESVERNGFALKELDDAIAIRNHLLRMFELASEEKDPGRCKALRTFVIVGGGPTGVECSGAISELVRLVLVKDYPDLDINDTRVLLLEMTDHVLAGFPVELAEAARDMLHHKHVDIRLGAAVSGYDGSRVVLKDGEVIEACTLIWAAGVRAEPLLGKTGLKQARQGRAVVDDTLQPEDHPEIYVIGDAAYLEDNGQPLPMLAPVAIQQGKLAAANIRRRLRSHPQKRFVYHDPGTLATIGRNSAVAQVHGLKFTGFLAWLVWLGVHIFWLIGFRNRLLVMINWAADYIFYERAVRVITLNSD
ncbi:MAG TPA: NAD(P)/FAD-dependent oxidoreductase, partial [Anaerolineales bacterium]